MKRIVTEKVCLLLYIFLLIATLAPNALAEETKLKLNIINEELKLDSNYWKGYITDTKSILGTPSNWKKVPAIISIGALLYNYDQDIQEWVQNNRNTTSNGIAKIVKPLGDGRYTLPPLGAFYLYGYLSENKKATRTALLSLESFVVSGIFVQITKLIGHRHRPNANDGYDVWDGPSLISNNKSFSSGHSQTAFSVATVIATEYSQSNIIPPIAYGLATLAALSRVNDNAHWASDAFIGSAIGYFTAKTILSLHDSKKDSSITIIPMTDGKNSSVSVIHTF